MPEVQMVLGILSIMQGFIFLVFLEKISKMPLLNRFKDKQKGNKLILTLGGLLIVIGLMLAISDNLGIKLINLGTL